MAGVGQIPYVNNQLTRGEPVAVYMSLTALWTSLEKCPARAVKRIAESPPASLQACGGTGDLFLFFGIVVQVRTEPSLNISQAHPLAFLIVSDLIAVDLAKTEIAGLWVSEIDPTHA